MPADYRDVVGEETPAVSARLKQRKGEPTVTVVTATDAYQPQTKPEDRQVLIEEGIP